MATYETEDEDLLNADAIVFEPEPEHEDAALRAAEGSDPRLALAVSVLKQVHESLGHVVQLLQGGDAHGGAQRLAELVTSKRTLSRTIEETSGVRVLEGMFDGTSMIGPDGKAYAVPVNYASKSRLVEGDILKLSIKSDGSFLFKQIGPVERRRLVGCLAYDASSNDHVVVCGDTAYKVLAASVSFFKGEVGDKVAVVLPKSSRCVWAAVEHIVKT